MLLQLSDSTKPPPPTDTPFRPPPQPATKNPSKPVDTIRVKKGRLKVEDFVIRGFRDTGDFDTPVILSSRETSWSRTGTALVSHGR